VSTSSPERNTDGTITSGMNGNTCAALRAKVEMKMPSITEAMASSHTTTNSQASVPPS